MQRSPSQDEREAYLLADIASASDAGLTVEQILSGPATASLPNQVRNAQTLTEGLVEKGLQLAPHEMLMLETAEHAGTFPKTLRTLATHRTARAERGRELRRRLAYPLFLLVFAVGVFSLISWLRSASPWDPILLIGSILGVIGAAALLVRQTVQNPDRGLIAPVRALVLDIGELPYLQSLHGLYGAGVKLLEAHNLALKTSPIAGVRRRLDETGRALARGGTLSDALQLCSALHPETRQMLASAEASGDLEDALERAIDRRQAAVDLRSGRFLRITIVAITVLAYGAAIYVIVGFWMERAAAIGSLLR